MILTIKVKVMVFDRSFPVIQIYRFIYSNFPNQLNKGESIMSVSHLIFHNQSIDNIKLFFIDYIYNFLVLIMFEIACKCKQVQTLSCLP